MFDDPIDGAERLLARRRNKGLLRSLTDLGSKEGDALMYAAARQNDPKRFKGLFLRDLQQSAADGALAQQLNQRDALRAAPQTDATRESLAELPKYGSIAERFDPRSPNSVASRFGKRRSLFRDL